MRTLILTTIIITLQIRYVQAEWTEKSEIIHCSRDAYVRQGSPTSNYGSESSFIVGYKNSDRYETYLYFEITILSTIENIDSVMLILPFYYVPQNISIDIYLISSSWEELSINWNNKPALSSFINTLKIEKNTSLFTKLYYINISSVVSGLNSISFCLRAPTETSYGQGDSKDGMSTGSRIEVKYLEQETSDTTTDDDNENSTTASLDILTIVAILIIISVIIGFILIIVFIRKRIVQEAELTTSERD